MLGVAVVLACLHLGIVDGDTVRCDGVRMRLLDIDAPETWRSRCATEHNIGEIAKERLDDMIHEPGVKIETFGAIDPYNRPLIIVRLPDGRSAGDVLLDEGLARQWIRGKKAHWCD